MPVEMTALESALYIRKLSSPPPPHAPEQRLLAHHGSIATWNVSHSSWPRGLNGSNMPMQPSLALTYMKESDSLTCPLTIISISEQTCSIAAWMWVRALLEMLLAGHAWYLPTCVAVPTIPIMLWSGLLSLLKGTM